jgi:predicted helicase
MDFDGRLTECTRPLEMPDDPVEKILEDIRAIAKDEYDKGTRFERLMLHAFQTDRTFQQQFSQVWMWMDWPDRGGSDIGVDLVARNTDGTVTAIQCKCYAPTATLTKEAIDPFLAHRERRCFNQDSAAAAA